MTAVIPKVNGYRKTQGHLILPPLLTVSTGGSIRPVNLFAERMRRVEGYEEFEVKMAENGILRLNLDINMEKETYVLNIQPDKICLTAGGEHGFSNGMVTLFWMCAEGKGKLECCRIEDEPRYGYRGFMLDVCRHFFTADEVKKVIEQMALLKLTSFHWHLSDDQGYRIESRKFPELNRKGSYRRETYGDGIPHGGFYTWEEIREIVSYAEERFIEVIPEIDLPGHTMAITASYPQYSCSGHPAEVATTFGIHNRILCAGKEEVYSFLEELLEEVCELFPTQYFHIGGDEAPKEEWKKCPDCRRVMLEQGYTDYEQLQAFFTGRLVKILKKRDKRVIGWNEAVYSGELDSVCITQFWQDTEEGEGLTFAEVEKGRQFICSNQQNFYFDYPYATFPMKGTFGYEPNIGGRRVPDESVLGVEAALWAESVRDAGRLEYMAFPRMAALAENAWSKSRGDFEEFRGRLPVYQQLLGRYGILYASLEEALISGEAAVRATVENMSRRIPHIIAGMQQDHAATEGEKKEMIAETVKLRVMKLLYTQMEPNFTQQEISMAEQLLSEKVNDCLMKK